MEKERGDLTELEQEVVRAMKEQEFVTANANEEFEQDRTLGDRVDRLITQQWQRLLEIQQIYMDLMAKLPAKCDEK